MSRVARFWPGQVPRSVRPFVRSFVKKNNTRTTVHDFFTPQPIRAPAVFFLRVVLHDWSDDYARKLLSRLREAAGEAADEQTTTLVVADFVMPLACVDDFGVVGGGMLVQGAERTLAPP